MPRNYRRDWASGHIPSKNKSILFQFVCSAVVFATFSAFSIPVIRQHLAEGKPFPHWALITPIIALVVVGWTALLLWGWLKYRESYFVLASVPGRIGGILSGIVQTSVKIPNHAAFRLRLSCVNRVVSGWGRNRRVEHRVLWRTQQAGVFQEKVCANGRSEILVEFSIPPHCRESDNSRRRDQIIWYLEVSADLPGRNYAAIFEVPVFKPWASSSIKPDQNTKLAKKRLKKARKKNAKQRTKETGAPAERD